MPPKLVFSQLPGQNTPVIQAFNYNNINQGLQFNSRQIRGGLRFSMINRVANSKPGCSSCGK